MGRDRSKHRRSRRGRRRAPAVTGTIPLPYRFLYAVAMKTTLDMDDELLARAKALAARERTTLTALIEEGLRLRLQSRRRGSGRPATPRLSVYQGRGGLAAGVDATSNRSMLDAADDDS